ncbi:4Fe-4S ferredoxin iron-sulfur binding domain protein [Desulfosarcina variabilis str. Montpellier]|uniref:4Fe-4S dicluster domain-containing protein n=1 Tax=Desulfosarcina variabilis TaxID=2300 RepID=UPI003AFB5DAF
MSEYTEKMRQIAGRLLKDCTVEMVIGFRKGTMPMMNEPCFVTAPEDADSLVWDSNCGINLANYLTNRKEKIAVFAKGCDSRNIVNHIVENKIQRDQLHIIGVPCTGMIDKRKIHGMVDGEILKVTETEETVKVRTAEAETLLDKKEVLQNNCALCIHRNPVISDEMLADPVEEQTDIDRYADVRKIEEMGDEEKWQFFEDLLAPCIRCYACRNACPLCYCPTCFVDESKPQWVGKGQDPIDIRTFHFLRAYHCAGRCTDCGACQRACPVGIDMRLLTRKLEKDCQEQFGWEAGLSLDSRPALDVYQTNDPEAFIK